MVTKDSVEKQLKRIGFNQHGWGRGEILELPNVLLPDENIFECVNGVYEGGFAILLATDVRLLLVDKKPLNFLNIEDMRFDMINELDYSHRLFGAHITVSAGAKTLKFTSYNQQRLRKAIGHVQHCMAEIKKKTSDHQEGQSQHLERLNQQLQSYLLAQHKSQQNLQERVMAQEPIDPNDPELNPPKPDPELADYLYAQSLLSQYEQAAEKSKDTTQKVYNFDARENEVTQDEGSESSEKSVSASLPEPETRLLPSGGDSANPEMVDLYTEGMQEIFGRRGTTKENTEGQSADTDPVDTEVMPEPPTEPKAKHSKGLLSFDVNPLKIAYSRLPMALRNRKFGRPSFHAHSQSDGLQHGRQAPA
jgi:hypothetical protein